MAVHVLSECELFNVSDPDVHILCELASKWAQRDVKLERGEDAEGR